LKTKFLYILFFLWPFAFEGEAQNYRLQFSGPNKDSFLLLSQIPIVFEMATDIEKVLQNARIDFIKKGYFAASIDSIQWKDSSAHAFVYLGKKYEWASLINKNIPQNLLTQFRFDEKKYFNKPIDLKKIESVFNKIIEYYENNGYPFCALQLDSLKENEGKITALLLLEKGPLTKIDSIKINEEANISKSYVLNYLGLKEGMIYDERKIKSINKKLRELNFIESASPWRIYFTSVKTTLHLYLKNKSANQADVLIGLLPNNSEIGGKFLVTGDVKLGLVNALNKGENIQINWQNLQYKSPRYDIKFLIPYILKSSIGLTGKFNFYKKDTTFKTINGQLGLLYQLSASDYVKAYYELASSQLVNVNIANLKFTRTLPANADVSYKTIGLETVFQQLDYRLNPRKGYSIFINAGLSFRTVLKNETIESTFDAIAQKPFSYLYDTLVLKNNKYQLESKWQYYFPLKKRATLATILNAGFTISNNTLYRNELFQIGGYRLLRGFDEGSLFVNNYQILTIEPRYLLSANSYFFLFTDVGFIQEKYNTINRNSMPYSVGLGMLFETKSGQFNISYAVGSMQNQGIQLKNSKIHFGYVNYF